MDKNNFYAFTWDEIVIKFTDSEFHLEIPLCIKASNSLAIKIYYVLLYCTSLKNRPHPVYGAFC